MFLPFFKSVKRLHTHWNKGMQSEREICLCEVDPSAFGYCFCLEAVSPGAENKALLSCGFSEIHQTWWVHQDKVSDNRG